MAEQEHQRAMADAEARATQMHAAELWRRLPESGKARYRLAAAAAIASEPRDSSNRKEAPSD